MTTPFDTSTPQNQAPKRTARPSSQQAASKVPGTGIRRSEDDLASFASIDRVLDLTEREDLDLANDVLFASLDSQLEALMGHDPLPTSHALLPNTAPDSRLPTGFLGDGSVPQQGAAQDMGSGAAAFVLEAGLEADAYYPLAQSVNHGQELGYQMDPPRVDTSRRRQGVARPDLGEALHSAQGWPSNAAPSASGQQDFHPQQQSRFRPTDYAGLDTAQPQHTFDPRSPNMPLPGLGYLAPGAHDHRPAAASFDASPLRSQQNANLAQAQSPRSGFTPYNQHQHQHQQRQQHQQQQHHQQQQQQQQHLLPQQQQQQQQHHQNHQHHHHHQQQQYQQHQQYQQRQHHHHPRQPQNAPGNYPYQAYSSNTNTSTSTRANANANSTTHGPGYGYSAAPGFLNPYGQPQMTYQSPAPGHRMEPPSLLGCPPPDAPTSISHDKAHVKARAYHGPTEASSQPAPQARPEAAPKAANAGERVGLPAVDSPSFFVQSNKEPVGTIGAPPAAPVPASFVLQSSDPMASEPPPTIVGYQGTLDAVDQVQDRKVISNRALKKQNDPRCDPSLVYTTAIKRPPPWGPRTRDGHHLFAYTHEWQLTVDRSYTKHELELYLSGSKCTIWIQQTPSQSAKRLIKDDRRCRWDGCPTSARMITAGWHRVAFDECPELTTDGTKDPFKMVGFMHLWCFEQCFDLVEFWAKKRVKPETRNFPKESHNSMSLERDVNREVIVETFEPWFAERMPYYEEYGPMQTPRHHVDSLARALVVHHLDNQTPARQNARDIRNANKPEDERNTIDIHKGNLGENVRRNRLTKKRRRERKGKQAVKNSTELEQAQSGPACGKQKQKKPNQKQTQTQTQTQGQKQKKPKQKRKRSASPDVASVAGRVESPSPQPPPPPPPPPQQQQQRQHEGAGDAARDDLERDGLFDIFDIGARPEDGFVTSDNDAYFNPLADWAEASAVQSLPAASSVVAGGSSSPLKRKRSNDDGSSDSGRKAKTQRLDTASQKRKRDDAVEGEADLEADSPRGGHKRVKQHHDNADSASESLFEDSNGGHEEQACQAQRGAACGADTGATRKRPRQDDEETGSPRSDNKAVKLRHSSADSALESLFQDSQGGHEEQAGQAQRGAVGDATTAATRKRSRQDDEEAESPRGDKKRVKLHHISTDSAVGSLFEDPQARHKEQANQAQEDAACGTTTRATGKRSRQDDEEERPAKRSRHDGQRRSPRFARGGEAGGSA